MVPREVPITIVRPQGSAAGLVVRRLKLGLNDVAVLPGGVIVRMVLAAWVRTRTGAPVRVARRASAASPRESTSP
jgi:hypothetical protein